MATKRTALTHWEGDLMMGKGNVALWSSQRADFDLSWPTRSAEPNGSTSPEELLAAAHSSCYSMALAHDLSAQGYTVSALDTQAEVTFTPGAGITAIALSVSANVPGLSEASFQKAAEEARKNCPVSQALASVKDITLVAELLG